MPSVLRLILLGAVLLASPALAIRPFITDDARVVGGKLAQFETWVLVDALVLEHNVLAAFGPTPWLEVTAGFFHGGVHSGEERGYSITGPVLQLKGLLHPAHSNSWPGLAISAGALAPAGLGAFRAPGWSTFAYLAATLNLNEERVLVHANIGGAVLLAPAATSGTVTAGIGTQVRIIGGLHGVAEVFYGDPYDPRSSAPSVQAGGRFIFNEHVQIDGTVGVAFATASVGHSQVGAWGTLGLRLVTPELW